MNKNLTIRLKSGFIINLDNISPESHEYIQKWLNRKWPELTYDFIDRNGSVITVTHPENVDFIVVKVVEYKP
jgi:hypothetical protein